MKTSTILSIHVAPELREAAERVLEEGETLSDLVRSSLRLQIERRLLQKRFVERGLASRDAARISREYHTVDDVLTELDKILADAESRASK